MPNCCRKCGGIFNRHDERVRATSIGGLVADMTTLSNSNPHTLVTNASELTKNFRDIQTVMQLCNHGLYQGNVYSHLNLASFTYAHMMDVESYLHHVMSNDSLRERVLKHFTVLSKTLAHMDCTIIFQLQFHNNIIEVLGGKVFQISSRSFVPCPLGPNPSAKYPPDYLQSTTAPPFQTQATSNMPLSIRFLTTQNVSISSTNSTSASLRERRR